MPQHFQALPKPRKSGRVNATTIVNEEMNEMNEIICCEKLKISKTKFLAGWLLRLRTFNLTLFGFFNFVDIYFSDFSPNSQLNNSINSN